MCSQTHTNGVSSTAFLSTSQNYASTDIGFYLFLMGCEDLLYQGITQIQKAYFHLAKLCTKIRNSKHFSVPEDGEYKVNGEADTTTVFAALVVCDWPNNEHIPKEEELAALREIMQQEGFMGEPKWFLSER
ncbi:hypothetical protein H0H81_007715 [Sphagnurus paluster]|uniref:Uncharacterized protein n=1 Tax=Sphagnurus paluster TaxID=117069 RepID=A0A9P7GLW9_9AGAR|nr:hypothetical protein H0H81_007715 [Sphagnurus paluster]